MLPGDWQELTTANSPRFLAGSKLTAEVDITADGMKDNVKDASARAARGY
jgi:hypothetical protein